MSQANVMEDFQRDFSYRLVKREDTILLTATMKDIFHDIYLEVVADIETLAVNAASVDFRKAPSEQCPNVQPALAKIVGMTIGKGMNRKIMESLGGGDGCGNIKNMLLGLLPLAINVKAAAGITDEKEMMTTIHNKLRGTCAGYASEPGTDH